MKYLKLVILIFIFFQQAAQGQNVDYDFFRPNQEEVFEHGINCIYKDNYGFLWIGTSQGLYRYDGYVYKSYNYQPGNNSSICNNNVRQITEDKEGFIWIGTFNGLSRYDRKTDSFKNYFHVLNDSTTIIDNQIKCFLKDKSQRLWVGTNLGMNLYQPEKDCFRQFTNLIPEQITTGRNIVCAVADVNDNLWIGAWDAGLVMMNPKTGKTIHFEKSTISPNSLKNNQIISLAFIDDSLLWIGHYNQGFCQLNIKTLKFDYTLFENNKNLLNQDFGKFLIDSKKNIWIANGPSLILFQSNTNNFWKINTPLQLSETNAPLKPQFLLEDKDSIIWINAFDEGFMYFHPEANNFKKYYKELPKENQLINKNYVKSFLEDKQGNLWIATFDHGLLKFSKSRDTFKRFLPLSNDPEKSVGSNRINHLFLDNSNKLWISTANGITIMNPETNQVEKKLNTYAPTEDGLYFNFISKVFQDSRGDFWIINQEGLDYYHPENNTFRHYTQNDQGGFSAYKFTSIAEDKDGALWFGTFNGLNKYDPLTKKVSQYFHDPNVQNSLSNSSIEAIIFIENKGQLWITTQNGLNLYDKKTDSFTRYPKLEGLLSNDITGIIECDDDHLWLITRSGLSKLNVNTQKILNYGKLEGLTINTEAFYKSPQGLLYFGGVHKDYFTFSDDDIKINNKIPPVYITDFLLFNKPLSISTNQNTTPLKENILVTDKIKLRYDQNSFGFEFAALNYLLPERNLYAYKLVGFDDDWTYTDYKRRYANYTNLSPGNYLFQVKASNNDGIWNETGDQLEIIILPPYWQRWYAFVFYVFTLAFLMYVARYITIKQTRLKSSLEAEQLLREREEYAHKQRISFFTNISHEFRTPLTLIAGPLKKIVMQSKSMAWDKEIGDYLSLIQRNVKRLTDLTNQLLDFRKVETGSMKLDPVKVDVIHLTKMVTDSFKLMAEKKQLKLEFISESEGPVIMLDADKLEKILSNLISNAIKFTPHGGVIVKIKDYNNELTEKGRFIEIKVEDTGIGIADDQLTQIFNPFHQVDLSHIRKNEGTGLGLALTENLVKLYNGEIQVTSEIGKGSCFSVKLPVPSKAYLANLFEPEIKEHRSDTSDYQPEEKSDELMPDITDKNSDAGVKKPLILVVEDNDDMRFYIRSLLTNKFEVKEAGNGNDGLKLALESIPDIIISDVMMPELSGTEMTNLLKADERTSHIPVILLTALTSKKQKIKGLTTGAVDYITKPFNDEILKIKVENLLNNRQRIKDHLLKQIESATQTRLIQNINPSTVVFEDVNEKFINKLLGIVEIHIQEVDFGVERLSREIGMEASTLYKKMMALIDTPPGEFIRDIRMKRAAQLLVQKHLSVTDVSFMVGYDDQKHFSKIFKKYHGLSPTEYRNTITE